EVRRALCLDADDTLIGKYIVANFFDEWDRRVKKHGLEAIIRNPRIADVFNTIHNRSASDCGSVLVCKWGTHFNHRPSHLPLRDRDGVRWCAGAHGMKCVSLAGCPIE